MKRKIISLITLFLSRLSLETGTCLSHGSLFSTLQMKTPLELCLEELTTFEPIIKY